MSLQGEAAASREMGGKLTLTDVIVVNAYDIAVKNGFNGTEKEWLASLKPKKGVDYMTPEDVDQIVQKVLAALSN